MTYGDAIRTVPPAALAVSLAELKAHLRLEGIDGEDAYLAGLVRVATDYVEQYTGLGLITQTWAQTFAQFPGTTYPTFLSLYRRPLQAVVSVDYLDSASSPAAATTLSAAGYTVAGVGADKAPGGSIHLASGAAWPVIISVPEAVTVTYTVGYGDDHNAVPELIRHAIMMAAGTFYAFREDVVMGSTIADLPIASKALLRDWRPPAVA